MCGIAGIVGSFTKDQGETLINKMLAVITHRGPDSNGLWATDGLALGMQRLSIIDLASGDQPIWSDDGVCIIFNGEIYNFKELRVNLQTAGVQFTTNSDTEVILQLYRAKGLEAINALEGMFAICLYDSRIDKIYLIRDRLGVKPLYYHHDKDTFIFGSEIKSILEVLPEQPEINQQAIWDQLTLRYVPAPETIWQGIYKLEPAHYLEYDCKLASSKITQYWSVNFKSEKLQKNRNYVAEFEQLFLEAVEKRLLAADVPVGIMLSGGLDSSCVAAAAAELGHKNFHTFSIGFAEGGEFSELKYARMMAQHIGSEHHEVIISQQEFLAFIDEFVWHSDEPLADLASIPLFYLSKLAAKYVKVALSGEGADEILAGYDLDNLASKLNYFKLASYLPKALLKILPYNSLQKLSATGYTNFLRQQIMHITNVFSEQEKEQLCRFSGSISTENYIKNLYNISTSNEPIDQLQQAYCASWLVEDLLMKADKMSMAASLEIRVPFLDHKLVEWAATLPLKWKIGSFAGGFTTKKILRQFAAKRLPAEIINRPKQGFPVPAYNWIKNDLAGFAKMQLNTFSFNNYIKSEHLEPVFADLDAGSDIAAHKIWNMMILAAWLKRWGV